jgi:hypothetical protein
VEEDFFLDGLRCLQQKIHGSVEIVHIDLGKARNEGFFLHPVLHVEFTGWVKSPVGCHGKDHPLHRGAVVAFKQQLLQGLANA